MNLRNELAIDVVVQVDVITQDGESKDTYITTTYASKFDSYNSLVWACYLGHGCVYDLGLLRPDHDDAWILLLKKIC